MKLNILEHKAYWKFGERESITGSAWMLEVFYLIKMLKITINNNNKNNIEKNTQKILDFVIEELENR